MCWLIVLKYFWCDCIFDEILIIDGKFLCLYYVLIFLYRLFYYLVEIFEVFLVIICLDIYWILCDFYYRVFSYVGVLSYRECYCMQRSQYKQIILLLGYKLFFLWDGFCVQCGGWGVGNGYFFLLILLIWVQVGECGQVWYCYQFFDGLLLFDCEVEVVLIGVQREEVLVDEIVYVSMD